MIENGFASNIEWHRSWLEPIRDLALPILSQHEWFIAINEAAQQQALANANGQPIHFVQQQTLPAGVAYESYIYATGSVPTRDNLHDFFNAMIWLRFPQIKRMLNKLQALELQRTQELQLNGIRGGQRDAATLFDENAAILICSQPFLAEALQHHEWEEVFLRSRDIFIKSCEVILFGHALLEKLVRPYKAITAHAWVVIVEPDWHKLNAPQRLAWIDAALAEQLELGFTAKNFTPLPVLGVPGWWPDQDVGFYADSTVFRPAKKVFNNQATQI